MQIRIVIPQFRYAGRHHEGQHRYIRHDSGASVPPVQCRRFFKGTAGERGADCRVRPYKEPGALGEPLYLDICGALYGKENAPLVIGGRYGLGSKDTTPAQIAAVFDNLTDVQPKNHLQIGIEDDVTHHSLAVHPDFPIQTPAGLMQCKFWGLGSDGTVGANKQAVKSSENMQSLCAGIFSYDSKVGRTYGFPPAFWRYTNPLGIFDTGSGLYRLPQ